MLVGSARKAGLMGLSNWLRAVRKKFLEAFRRQPAQIGSGSAAKKYSDLTRFIFDKNHFSSVALKAKPGAFLPASDLKTSALGKDMLGEGEIWKIGLLVGQDRGKAPRARADFDDRAVGEAKLTIEPDPQPNIPDHLNLCGWPAQKDEQKDVALLLCARAKVVLRPGVRGKP
jgi:hypothetical protein